MLQYKSVPARVALTDANEPGVFTGKASVFHVLDSYNEIVAPGAFAGTLDSFLSRGVIRSQHSVSIGRPTAAREEDGALVVSGKISDTAAGRDTLTLLRDGVIQSLSIGFRPVSSTKLIGAKDVQEYWTGAGYQPTDDEMTRAKHGARVLTAVELLEVSPVDFPANPACSITAVKAPLVSLADLLAVARAEAEEVKAGRVLSDANRRRLEALASSLRSAADDLDALLSSTMPVAPEQMAAASAEFRRERLRYLRAATQRLGTLTA